jgi:ribosome biogenesis GTPase
MGWDAGAGEPARVLISSSPTCQVETADGVLHAELSGRFRHDARGPDALPSVGDWVVIRRASAHHAHILGVLPRQSCFRRLAAGDQTRAQVVAANVDTVLVALSLNHNFDLRRLERYLTTIWDSGAAPLVLLTKVDLVDDPQTFVEKTAEAALGVDVLPVSAVTGAGLDELRSRLLPGRTYALVGSSGVGKSSLVNFLLGHERQRVLDVRADDDRGRHTTTHRELFRLPGGALLIDTPGMRTIRLWADEDSLLETFDDIQRMGEDCRFRDCRHVDEPGCAVLEAIAKGGLDEGRYRGFLKLRREVAWLERQKDELAQRAEHKRWKQITKGQRELRRLRGY